MAVQFHFDSVRRIDQPFEFSLIPTTHGTSIPTDWAFVIEIQQPMIGQSFRTDFRLLIRLGEQTPRSTRRSILQQKIPVQERMIVN